MNKAALIDRIRAELERELATLTQAAEIARAAATHEESRSEDKHDTRGVEASYLAGAQAARAAEIQKQIRILDAIPLKPQSADSKIAAGSLVELDASGKKTFCLLSPTGGGITLTLEGVRVQVVTPQSPLGEALLGSLAGEEIEVEPEGGTKTSRTYTILSIQ